MLAAIPDIAMLQKTGRRPPRKKKKGKIEGMNLVKDGCRFGAPEKRRKL